MLKLESIAAFCAIAEAGSITGAARRLALSKSVVSERLTELERVVGTTLVRRTTRSLSLTDDGNTFHERAKQILRNVESAASELTERRGTLTGPLRISAPVSFGTLHLGQALFAFLAKYPGIELTLELDDRIIVKRLSASRRLLVASADYLKRFGNPTSLQDLAKHRGILYGNRGAADWRFRVGRKWVIARPQVALRVNNGLLMRDAAVAGLGIALLATFLLETPLKKRTLKVLDIGAEAEGATIYIAYPEHLRSSGKIRALTAWLRRSIGDPTYWDADFDRDIPRGYFAHHRQ